MSKLVRGDKLAPATRADVLRAFGYRWTTENEGRARSWYAAGKLDPPTMPLVSDAAWLAAYAFHVRKDGKLDARRRAAVPANLAGLS